MAEHFIPRERAEHDLLDAAAYLAETIGSADGYAEAMSAVVPLYLKRGDVDTAAELANTVDDSYTRDRLLTQVAEKCAEVDDDEYAVQLAEAVEDVGLRSQAYERVALQKAAAGQFDAARDVAGELPHPDFVYAGIAVNQAENGDAVSANATLNSIEFASARVQASLEISAAMTAKGNIDAAVAHLDNAASAAAEIEHNEERLRALVETAGLFQEAGQTDRAVAAFERAVAEAEALGNIHRDGFLASAAVGLLRAGRVDLADRTLDLVSDKTQIASCLLGYAREYWRKGEREEALDALEEALAVLRSQRDTEIRDSRARNTLFTAIAAQFAGFEKGERAIGIAQSIADERQQTEGLIQVAEILTLRKEKEEARHALQAIADDADKSFALIRMSDAAAKAGDSGAELLNEAEHLAEAVPQLSSRSAVYNEIARRCAELGDDEKAVDLLRLNLRTIAALRDESRKVTALAETAAWYGDQRASLSEDVRAELVKLLG